MAGRADFDWMDSALCAQVDPELFFPGVGRPNRVPEKVCARCLVTTECATWGDAVEETELAHAAAGIWGGRRHFTNAFSKREADVDDEQETA